MTTRVGDRDRDMGGQRIVMGGGGIDPNKQGMRINAPSKDVPRRGVLSIFQVSVRGNICK